MPSAESKAATLGRYAAELRELWREYDGAVVAKNQTHIAELRDEIRHVILKMYIGG